MKSTITIMRDNDCCITREKMTEYEYVQMRCSFVSYFQNQGPIFTERACPTMDETVDLHIWEKKNPFIVQRKIGDKENIVENRMCLSMHLPQDIVEEMILNYNQKN